VTVALKKRTCHLSLQTNIETKYSKVKSLNEFCAELQTSCQCFLKTAVVKILRDMWKMQAHAGCRDLLMNRNANAGMPLDNTVHSDF